MRHGIGVGLLVAGLGCALAASAPAEVYKVVKKASVGGKGRWDYLAVDSAARRLYVARARRVMVLDADSANPVGEIPDTPGVGGVANAPDLGRRLTSNGREGTATIFDLGTLKAIGEEQAARTRTRFCTRGDGYDGPKMGATPTVAVERPIRVGGHHTGRLRGVVAEGCEVDRPVQRRADLRVGPGQLGRCQRWVLVCESGQQREMAACRPSGQHYPLGLDLEVGGVRLQPCDLPLGVATIPRMSVSGNSR